MKLVVVCTTVGSRGDAQAMCRALVERRLVACAQFNAIESVYRWGGVPQDDQEFRLLLKTTAERYADVEAAIRELHAYELPAIYSVPVEHAFGPYAEWIGEAVDAGRGVGIGIGDPPPAGEAS